MKFLKSILNAFSSQPRQSTSRNPEWEYLRKAISVQFAVMAIEEAIILGHSAIELLRESDFLNTLD